ncbi:flagellar motor stator protein MotA [Lacrimispora sphenoides]|uniref:Chemotaxis protein MotA n=1 Tax=Lacrimispora sphenoides JCM 1415 TaxID=1297793 RepID=A0ABY1CDQ7_9FIRM|nr:flagellar motor stator protein MotA [Lacrimispora sphenoides]SET95010.1 chemotaxis protein MotA [[Clostridium] sphenoides JCM 1415]SUY52649.1 flagellar motor protein MotA [Lacrimispora sphenoides]
MEITTILGVIVGVVAVVGAMIFKHIEFSVLMNPAAFFVIIVGTVATILNSFPGQNIKSIGSLFRVLFTKQKGSSESEMIELMYNLSKQARSEGLLSLEAKAEELQDPFLKKGIRLLVDGAGEELIEEILETEIAAMEKRHEINASIFSSAGTYAPTLGVLGAVFGLIAAMSSINDTERMAEAIAAAFIATILGIFTGYVLWNPFAKKLKVKSQQEVMAKEIIIKGVLSMQHGDSPFILREKLLAALPKSKQKKLSEQDPTSDQGKKG